MAICRSLLLLPFLLVAIAFSCAAIAHASDASVPFLLVHKKVSLEKLKSGSEQVTVSIDLYNEGSTYVPLDSLDFFQSLVSFNLSMHPS
jgi:translocon-associated protein subunit beta